MNFFSKLFGRAKPSAQQSTIRGFLPDATANDALIIFKACGFLRLTHEIRVATFLAAEHQKRLRLIAVGTTKFCPLLQAFAATHGVSLEHSSS